MRHSVSAPQEAVTVNKEIELPAPAFKLLTQSKGPLPIRNPTLLRFLQVCCAYVRLKHLLVILQSRLEMPGKTQHIGSDSQQMLKIAEAIQINKTTNAAAFGAGNEVQGFELFWILHGHFSQGLFRNASSTTTFS